MTGFPQTGDNGCRIGCWQQMKARGRSRGRRRANAVKEIQIVAQNLNARTDKLKMKSGAPKRRRRNNNNPRTRPEETHHPPPALVQQPPVPQQEQGQIQSPHNMAVDLAQSSTCSQQLPTDSTLNPDEDGDLPIHIAVAQEREHMVLFCINSMVAKRVPVDICNNMRQSPLHIATLTANANIVSHLLNAGASIAIPDRRGNTPVHLATKAAAHQCLDLLLRSPERNKALSMYNYNGLTPLHLAVFTRDTSIIRMLVERGADCNCVDGTSGRTALFHAVENNYEEVVELLLDLGARANLPNYSGVTPLTLANERRQKNISHLLMAKGASSADSHDIV